MRWGGFGLGRYTLVHTVLEPVTASGDRDDFGVMEQPIENGAGGGDVAQELSPFFDGTIGSHQGGAVFIATHDDLQEDFAAFGRQDLEPHVVNDKEIGLEVFSQQSALAGLGGTHAGKGALFRRLCDTRDYGTFFGQARIPKEERGANGARQVPIILLAIVFWN